MNLCVYCYTKDDINKHFIDDEGNHILINYDYQLNNSYFEKHLVKNFLVVSDHHKNEFDLFISKRFPISQSYYYIGKVEDALNKYNNGELNKLPHTYKNYNKESNFNDEENFFIKINDDTKKYILELFEILLSMIECNTGEEKTLEDGSKISIEDKLPEWIVTCETTTLYKFLELYKYRTCFANNMINNQYGTQVYTWCEYFLRSRDFRRKLKNDIRIIFENLIIKYRIFMFNELDNMNHSFMIKNKDKIIDFIKKYNDI